MLTPSCLTILFLLFVLRTHTKASLIGADFGSDALELVTDRGRVRNLRAARTKSSIKARGIEGCLQNDIALHYLDEQTDQTSSQFSARVHMSTRLPTVVLEDVEHHIDEIECFDSSIHLYFEATTPMLLAYKELSEAEDFFAVTSHPGCNSDGEREPHRVSGLSLHEEEQLLILHTSRTQWKDVAHLMKLDFGPSKEDFELRRHPDLDRPLRPRQDGFSSAATSAAAPSSTAAAAASSTALTSETTGSATLTVNVTVPYLPSAAPTPAQTYASSKFSHYVSQTILPPPDIGFSVDGLSIPSSFTLACKNCTILGDISVLSGSLTTNLTASDDSARNAFEFWEHGGYVELLVNGFFAHIELETTLAPTKELEIYIARFPPLVFSPFQIPGIAGVGLQLIPRASMGIKMGTQLTFNYGFEVTVPDNSSVTLVVGNITNSSSAHFQESKITALPFQSRFDSIDLSLNTGFSPLLLLGATVFDGHGSIGAGMFFDLPTVSADIKHVEHVNSTCDPVDASSSDQVAGGLTNIVPALVFDTGLFASAGLEGLDLTIAEQETYTLGAYAMSLPTACLGFDRHASTFGPAVNPATATATGTGSNGAQATSSAVRVINPLTWLVGGQGRWDLVAELLVLVSVFFANL